MSLWLIIAAMDMDEIIQGRAQSEKMRRSISKLSRTAEFMLGTGGWDVKIRGKIKNT